MEILFTIIFVIVRHAICVIMFAWGFGYGIDSFWHQISGSPEAHLHTPLETLGYIFVGLVGWFWFWDRRCCK